MTVLHLLPLPQDQVLFISKRKGGVCTRQKEDRSEQGESWLLGMRESHALGLLLGGETRLPGSRSSVAMPTVPQAVGDSLLLCLPRTCSSPGPGNMDFRAPALALPRGAPAAKQWRRSSKRLLGGACLGLEPRVPACLQPSPWAYGINAPPEAPLWGKGWSPCMSGRGLELPLPASSVTSLPTTPVPFLLLQTHRLFAVS